MPLNAFDPAVPGEIIAAAYFNQQTVEQFEAIAAGSADLDGVQFAGIASDPAVAAAGQARIYYNSTDQEIRASVTGNDYGPIGQRAYADPHLIGGTIFGFRY